MLKLLHLIVWFAMWVGIGDSLFHLAMDLMGSAIHAHRHGQISYEKFSRMLTSDSGNQVSKKNQHHK